MAALIKWFVMPERLAWTWAIPIIPMCMMGISGEFSDTPRIPAVY